MGLNSFTSIVLFNVIMKGGLVMAEEFKFPGSSYEELVKIIKAYSISKTAKLDEVAQSTGMDKTIISRNGAFLANIGLLDGTTKQRIVTDLCKNLGRAYSFGKQDDIIKYWREAITENDFLNRMIAAVRIRNGMEKDKFHNHILYSSGENVTSHLKTGANTVIEILKVAQFLSEEDGKLTAVENEIESAIVENTNKTDIINTNKECENEPVHIKRITAHTPRSIFNFNININVDVKDLDALGEKLKKVINDLEQA